MSRIRKAIFPVAGLGTRFLPATKAMPKEMLPVVDRPLIQHVVDEARQAGIEHCIFVTGRNKSVIEDHFDRQFELEVTLIERGKKADLALLSQDLPEPGGPWRTAECGSPSSMAVRSVEPSPSRCSWPTSSSSTRGRIRTARGASEAGTLVRVCERRSSPPGSKS